MHRNTVVELTVPKAMPVPPHKSRETSGAFRVHCVLIALVLSLGACCAFANLDRSVVITHSSGLQVDALPRDAGGRDPLNANGIPLPRFALRAGDTATFFAQAEETYLGDNGCEAEGPLGPSSAQDPDGFIWSVEDPARLAASPDGLVHSLAVGETLLWAERREPRVKGGALVRVLPWFDSISVQATRDSVLVGDTVTILVTALRGGSPVAGINFRSAGIQATWVPAEAFVNSVYSVLDESPVRMVVIAQTAGRVGLVASHHVVSFGPAVGVDSVTVLPAPS